MTVVGCSKWATETIKERTVDTRVANAGMVHPELTIAVILRGIAVMATSWRLTIRCHKAKVWMILD